MSDDAGSDGSTHLETTRWQFADDSAVPLDLDVAIEVPINIRYGPLPYAVMMATPSDLNDFAIGFSLSEGIVDRYSDIRAVAVSCASEAITIAIDLAPAGLKRHLSRKRSLAGRTSCGVCGIEDAKDLPMAVRRVPQSHPIRATAISAALGNLRENQPLHGLTRSVHAAAWCDRTGRIAMVREDVGRHNALDKLIGAALAVGRDASDGFILVTSRASFEMVEKAARFQVHTLVTVSAPTSLAVSRAKALSLNLVSIARDDGCVVFAGALAR